MPEQRINQLQLPCAQHTWKGSASTIAWCLGKDQRQRIVCSSLANMLVGPQHLRCHTGRSKDITECHLTLHSAGPPGAHRPAAFQDPRPVQAGAGGDGAAAAAAVGDAAAAAACSRPASCWGPWASPAAARLSPCAAAQPSRGAWAPAAASRACSALGWGSTLPAAWGRHRTALPSALCPPVPKQNRHQICAVMLCMSHSSNRVDCLSSISSLQEARTAIYYMMECTRKSKMSVRVIAAAMSFLCSVRRLFSSEWFQDLNVSSKINISHACIQTSITEQPCRHHVEQ